MFEVFDVDGDRTITFEEFAQIMDVLCNGSDEDKNQFSFQMMDLHGTGYIDFREFRTYFQNVLQHWSSLVNSHIKVDEE